MGKVRINTIGDEKAEQKQAAAAKAKAAKKAEAKAQTDKAGNYTETSKTVTEEESKKTQSSVATDSVKTSIAKEAMEDKAKKTTAHVAVKKASPRGSKHSKKYNDVVVKVDKTKSYPLSDAVELLSEVHLAKFDETVELHINTDKTGISGTVTLPHGTGKQVRVAIVAPSQDAQAADNLIKEIESGSINFDVLIATPDAMPRLGRIAKILGPRGLMPNPKNGTVTQKPEEAAKQYAGGQINFKSESKMPIIHMSVGKLSFKKDQLVENITVALDAVQNKNIKDITLKSTMSPGIKIQI